ncbi:hypothetical protein [Ekhidna sp.]|uniref:hypothetical protein n=1 Tax=Ekhidna sp. TaxID=2608089 RepID=UPI003CCBA36E
MENKDYIKTIERKIREIANEYTSNGYLVTVNPTGTKLPEFLRGYHPDIIATKEDENVLIEVKTRSDRGDLKRFENLAEEISSLKNWRFEVVFTNPRRKPLALDNQLPLNELGINNRIEEINKLIRINSFEAAFLLGWATIEAALRHKLIKEKFKAGEKTTQSIIKTTFSLGLLNQNDYKTLQNINNKRNHLIHGFDQPIDKETVLQVIDLLNNLIGNNRESELLEWIEWVDLDGYEEIYCLYKSVKEKDEYGLFKVIEKDDKYILIAEHMDETLEFNSEEEMQQFTDLIEEEYMDDMDAESWYGFNRAMDKND